MFSTLEIAHNKNEKPFRVCSVGITLVIQPLGLLPLMGSHLTDSTMPPLYHYLHSHTQQGHATFLVSQHPQAFAMVP
jgi:hypothetical protein